MGKLLNIKNKHLTHDLKNEFFIMNYKRKKSILHMTGGTNFSSPKYFQNPGIYKLYTLFYKFICWGIFATFFQAKEKKKTVKVTLIFWANVFSIGKNILNLPRALESRNIKFLLPLLVILFLEKYHKFEVCSGKCKKL